MQVEGKGENFLNTKFVQKKGVGQEGEGMQM